MKLPKTAHTSRNWRIDEIVPDFRLEDVWALPTPGGPNDFPLLVQGIASADPAKSLPRSGRALWELRWKLGELLGWDELDPEPGARAPSIRDRLPADLRIAPPGPDFDGLPFTSLYQIEDEWAAELANRTVHGVMHLGWVEEENGRYRGQLAVYVKPNGLLGSAYMAAIKPFRYLIVYPQMMRELERRWRERPTDLVTEQAAGR
ncbi:MAG TPA: DUF2867 domain-containing protein [Solirubrobacterales bacterium]|nr:DUF2867 domain-containing protein [Solirubrobacterales bacterium]